MRVETKVEEGMNSYSGEYNNLEEEFCRDNRCNWLELRESDENLNRTDGKRTVRLAYLQNFIPIGRLDREISTFLF